MALTDPKIRAAQAIWTLKLAILQEQERRLVCALEQPSGMGTLTPSEYLASLKAARAQCNDAFESVEGIAEIRVAQAADAMNCRGHGHA